MTAGLSGPVCAMLLSAAATNLGLLPPASPRMAELQSLAVALALPLLLLAADLRAILADTGYPTPTRPSISPAFC